MEASCGTCLRRNRTPSGGPRGCVRDRRPPQRLGHGQSIYGSCQSDIQAVLNAELTLARWDGQTPITAFRDHMKAPRLTITPQQFYQYFINSLPAEYNMVIVVHDPTTSNHLVDVLCDAFRAIELRKELCTSTAGSTSEDPV